MKKMGMVMKRMAGNCHNHNAASWRASGRVSEMGTREVIFREVLGDLFGLLVFTIIKFTLSINRSMDHQGRRTISLWLVV